MANDVESRVWDALKLVKFPGMSRDIVSFGFVHQVKVSGGSVVIDLQMSTHNPAAGQKVKEDVERIVRDLAGIQALQWMLSFNELESEGNQFAGILAVLTMGAGVVAAGFGVAGVLLLKK